MSLPAIPGAFEAYVQQQEQVPDYPEPPAYSQYPPRIRKVNFWDTAAPIISADAPTMLTFAILMHLLLLFYSVGIVEMGPETYMGIQLILLAFMLRRSIEMAEDVYKAYKYEVPSPTCECRGCQWRNRD